MRMPEPQVKRHVEPEEEEEETLQTKPLANQITPLVQRQPEPVEEEEELQETPVFPKLTVGAQNDKYERQADQVADKVMRMPNSNGTTGSEEEQEHEQEQEVLSTQPNTLQTKAQSNSHPVPAVSANIAKTIQSASGGSPLSSTVRNKVQTVLKTDLGHVRVHTDNKANDAALGLNAKAFTVQNNIFMGHGQHAEDTRLMAHELTHTIQQSSKIQREPANPHAGTVTLQDLILPNGEGFSDSILQLAYQSYFASNPNPMMPVKWALSVTSGVPRQRLVKLLGPDYAKGKRTGASTRLLSTIKQPAGYDPSTHISDVRQVMQSPHALFDRLANMLQTPMTGGRISRGHLSILKGNVGEILAYPEMLRVLDEVRQTYPDAELFTGVRATLFRPDGTASEPVAFTDGIIATARPGGLYIHVIFEVKTGSVGGAAATRQVLKWIEAHATFGMFVHVENHAPFLYTDNLRTVHNLVTARRHVISATGTEHLGARIEPEVLAPITRASLGRTAEEIDYITRSIAEYVAALQRVRATVLALQGVALKPLQVDSLVVLQDPEIINRAIASHNGLALLGDRIYRLSLKGQDVKLTLVPPRPWTLTLPAPAPAPALPSLQRGPTIPPPQGTRPRQPNALPPGTTKPPMQIPPYPGRYYTAAPPVINLLRDQPIRVGNVELPANLARAAQVGEYIVVGGAPVWTVYHKPSNRPVATVMHGGKLVKVTDAKSATMVISMSGGVVTGVKPMQVGGRYARVIDFNLNKPVQSGSRFSGKTRAVAGGLAILQVVNDILGGIARTRNQQQANIEYGKARIAFWTEYGANPTIGLWDQTSQKPLDYAEAETDLFNPTFPYIKDIDVAGLKQTLPGKIPDYRALLLWLDMGDSIHAITVEPPIPNFPTREQRKIKRQYRVIVDRHSRTGRGYWDITDLVEQIRDRTLANLESAMKAKPPGGRTVYCLKRGSETELFRSAYGGQPIWSDRRVLGPDPWVYKIKTRKKFLHDRKAYVEPANADAMRAALVSSYEVKQKIEATKREVEDAGRPVSNEQYARGQLQSFLAGPLPGDPRFGQTRYYRHSNLPRTVAIGQLNQFWVYNYDLKPVP